MTKKKTKQPWRFKSVKTDQRAVKAKCPFCAREFLTLFNLSQTGTLQILRASDE